MPCPFGWAVPWLGWAGLGMCCFVPWLGCPVPLAGLSLGWTAFSLACGVPLPCCPALLIRRPYLISEKCSGLGSAALFLAWAALSLASASPWLGWAGLPCPFGWGVPWLGCLFLCLGRAGLPCPFGLTVPWLGCFLAELSLGGPGLSLGWAALALGWLAPVRAPPCPCWLTRRGARVPSQKISSGSFFKR